MVINLLMYSLHEQRFDIFDEKQILSSLNKTTWATNKVLQSEAICHILLNLSSRKKFDEYEKLFPLAVQFSRPTTDWTAILSKENFIIRSYTGVKRFQNLYHKRNKTTYNWYSVDVSNSQDIYFSKILDNKKDHTLFYDTNILKNYYKNPDDNTIVPWQLALDNVTTLLYNALDASIRLSQKENAQLDNLSAIDSISNEIIANINLKEDKNFVSLHTVWLQEVDRLWNSLHVYHKNNAKGHLSKHLSDMGVQNKTFQRMLVGKNSKNSRMFMLNHDKVKSYISQQEAKHKNNAESADESLDDVLCNKDLENMYIKDRHMLQHALYKKLFKNKSVTVISMDRDMLVLTSYFILHILPKFIEEVLLRQLQKHAQSHEWTLKNYLRNIHNLELKEFKKIKAKFSQKRLSKKQKNTHLETNTLVTIVMPPRYDALSKTISNDWNNKVFNFTLPVEVIETIRGSVSLIDDFESYLKPSRSNHV